MAELDPPVPVSRRSAPSSEPAPSSTFDGEDFLFHLYRGSELLQDDCVSEAKEELERALAMQPRDVEGQGLLGVVYFRLGLYPRAIQIFEELARSCPSEITPKVNLALSYLKTGQLAQSRELLEEVIRIEPAHKRAWGYLGLVFERLGDRAKAQASFERAGQEQMARRMAAPLADESSPASLIEEPPHERALVREAAADAALALERGADAFTAATDASGADDEASPPSRASRWRALEPGATGAPPPRAPVLPLLSLASGAPESSGPARGPGALAPAALLREQRVSAGAAGAALLADSTSVALRVESAVVVRPAALRALGPAREPFASGPAMRRSRGRELDEPLGGASAPFTRLEGAGLVVLGVTDAGGRAWLVRLVDELFYLREERLLGFEGTLRYESGRLPSADGEAAAVLQLGGPGVVAFEARRLASLEVGRSAPLTVRGREVVGWLGRLLPQPLAVADAPGGASGLVSFSGDGAILLDG
ncbi:MAG: tetratricopeptide repeat protein [Polyangiaceae bacterium]|nr:tetratricopeptide repeat protein [Polyangiaceae bacterium]